MPTRDAESKRPRAGGRQADAASIRRVRVDELLGDAREAILEHDGQAYRLRITSKGKLILTK